MSVFSATNKATTMLVPSLLPPSRYVFQPIQCDDESDNSFDEDKELQAISLHLQYDHQPNYQGSSNFDPYPYNQVTSDELHELHQFEYFDWADFRFQCENIDDLGNIFTSFSDDMSIADEIEFDEDDVSDDRDQDDCGSNEIDHFCLRDVFETTDLDASLRYHNSDDALPSSTAFSPTCVVDVYSKSCNPKIDHMCYQTLSQVSANAA